MGIGNAFNTALGGLNSYAQQVGYISDNLANVNTPAYKRVDANFLSYVTASTQNYHSPGGVTIKPVYRTTLAGQVSTSDNPTSFSVSNGVGFVPVGVPSVTAGVASFANSTQHYTRACDFSVDNDGYLVNTAGQYLEGLKESTAYTGNIPGTPSLGSIVGIRVDPTVYKSIPGAASTSITYNANFPAGLNTAAVTSEQPAGWTSVAGAGPAGFIRVVFTNGSGNYVGSTEMAALAGATVQMTAAQVIAAKALGATGFDVYAGVNSGQEAFQASTVLPVGAVAVVYATPNPFTAGSAVATAGTAGAYLAKATVGSTTS
ncbi:MAG: flagellar hook-basal body complex protein, partial [Rhodospirillaceae bacterium]